jgi:hypothetical protein
MSDFTPQEDVYLEINEQEPNNQPTEDVLYKEPDNANYQILLYTVDDPYDEYYFSTKAILDKCYANVLHAKITGEYDERLGEILADNLILPKNPQIKAIIINQLVPGFNKLATKIKEQYADVLLVVLATKNMENIIDVADIVLAVDEFPMGKKMVEQTNRTGAKTFVYYTFPIFFGMPSSILSQYNNAFQTACSELGLDYVEIMDYGFSHDYYGIDPEAIFFDISQKISQYDGEVSIFADICSLQETIIAIIRDLGGIYAQPCHPSLYIGFHKALGILHEYYYDSLDDFDLIDFGRQIEEIETKLAEHGSTGSFSTWKVPFPLAATTAAIEYSTNYCEGNIKGKADLEAMRECFQRAMEIYNSADTGFELTQHPDYPNCFLFTEDYIVLQGNRE